MMVELMVGITVITLSMGALFLLLARSIAFTRTVSDEYVATYLAAEGIELVKSFVEASFKAAEPYNARVQPCAPGYEIDTNDWAAAAAQCQGGTNFLKLDENTGRYTYGIGKPTKFKRAVQVEWNQGGAPYIFVTSTVRWQARDGEKTIVLKDLFYDLCNLRSSDPSQCP